MNGHEKIQGKIQLKILSNDSGYCPARGVKKGQTLTKQEFQVQYTFTSCFLGKKEKKKVSINSRHKKRTWRRYVLSSSSEHLISLIREVDFIITPAQKTFQKFGPAEKQDDGKLGHHLPDALACEF